jgi:hypothetical protein
MKRIFILLAFLSPIFSVGQDADRVIRKGLLACKGTLAIGAPMDYSGTNMYISGNLQYYTEDNTSYRGEIWVFLGTDGDKKLFKHNHTLFTNFNYHFSTQNNLDPYIGIGPGVSWTELKEPEDLTLADEKYTISNYPRSVSPIATLTIGLNYYTKFAHLFVEAKYVQGIHLSDISPVSLNELRIAFGFGFTINTIAKK